MGGSESKQETPTAPASKTTPAAKTTPTKVTKPSPPPATNVRESPKTHRKFQTGSPSSSGISSGSSGSSTRSNTKQQFDPPSGARLKTKPVAHTFDKDKKRNIKHNKIIVAAIDFGTAFSGFAYCDRKDYTDSASKIIVHPWAATTTMTFKAPTCVLLHPDKTVRSFGYEANSEFQDAEDIDNCYFFKHFKMKLFEEREELSKDRTMLKDETGKSLPAIQVFASVIEYFKIMLLKKLQEKDDQSYFTNDDIHWVITVPAIWNLKAKHFMREAADMAGIDDRQLTLALEPEAASLYCRKVPNSIKTEGNTMTIASFPEGAKYLIVDLGGGTLDMTAHEVLEDNGLKEIHQASGGYWGGQRVNEEFIKFLKTLVGNDVLCEIREDHSSEWQTLIDDFERKKCAYDPESVIDKITINVPVVLTDAYEEATGCALKSIIHQTSYSGKIEIQKNKLRMKKSFFESLFDESIKNVLKSMDKLLNEKTIKGVDTILMVGGYSECTLMQKEIKKKFKDDYRIVIPTDPQVAVLRGAVIYGYEPEVIKSRVCRYTYGTAHQRKFIPGFDNPKKSVRHRGQDFVDDAFDKHVEVGQVAKLHEFQEAKPYYPLDDKQKIAWIDFYASDDKDPKFVTEDNCTCLGFIEVELSERQKGDDATVLVRINVSGTDIEVEAEEKSTGKKTRAYCSFLG